MARIIATVPTDGEAVFVWELLKRLLGDKSVDVLFGLGDGCTDTLAIVASEPSGHTNGIDKASAAANKCKAKGNTGSRSSDKGLREKLKKYRK